MKTQEKITNDRAFEYDFLSFSFALSSQKVTPEEMSQSLCSNFVAARRRGN
jgi:hypothetical protein